MTTAFFKSTDSDSRPPARVEVVRRLTADEADFMEVGPMFRIRYEDGQETDAFADELTEWQGVIPGALNDPRMPCCGRDAADCDCEPTPEPTTGDPGNRCYSDHNEDIRTKGSCDMCGGSETE